MLFLKNFAPPMTKPIAKLVAQTLKATKTKCEKYSMFSFKQTKDIQIFPNILLFVALNLNIVLKPLICTIKRKKILHHRSEKRY